MPLVEVIGPAVRTGDFAVHQGGDYLAGQDRAFEWAEPEEGWADLDGAVVTFTARARTTDDKFSKVMAVVSNVPGARRVRLELTGMETGGFDSVLWEYRVDISGGTGGNATLADGRMRVRAKLA